MRATPASQEMAHFVGVDLGATTVRAAVATADGAIVASERQPTPQGPSGIAVTEAVLDTIRSACGADARNRPGERSQ